MNFVLILLLKPDVCQNFINITIEQIGGVGDPKQVACILNINLLQKATKSLKCQLDSEPTYNTSKKKQLQTVEVLKRQYLF